MISHVISQNYLGAFLKNNRPAVEKECWRYFLSLSLCYGSEFFKQSKCYNGFKKCHANAWWLASLIRMLKYWPEKMAKGWVMMKMT
jgi:hypothetical protein